MRQRPRDVDATDAIEDAARRDTDSSSSGVAGIGGLVGAGGGAALAAEELIDLTEEAQQSSFAGVDATSDITPFVGAEPLEAADVAQPTIEAVGERPLTVQEPAETTKLSTEQTQSLKTETEQTATTRTTAREIELSTTRPRPRITPDFETAEDDDEFIDDPLSGVQDVEAELRPTDDIYQDPFEE
jgi:hypothetical protein